MEKQIFKQENVLKIGIIGGGSIGLSFAVLFAKSNVKVQLYEPDTDRFEVIREELLVRLLDLQKYNLLSLDVEVVLGNIQLIKGFSDIDVNTEMIIECAPEKLEIKRKIFLELDRLMSKDVILVSASSAIMMSKIASNLPNRYRCLIAHPGNPPHLIPIIELVPADFTEYIYVKKTKDIFEAVGQSPVILNLEIEGFIFNRLQGAVLREAYCLVRDGVASVEDIDKVMTHGVGLRWSIIGPFESIDLNTRGGVESHAKKMGPAYERMGKQRGQNDPWTEDLVANVANQRRGLLSLEEWDERIRWRDEQIMKLISNKLHDR